MRNTVVALLTLGSVAAAQEQVHIYVSLERQHASSILHRFEQETSIRVVATYDTEATKTVGLVRRLIEEKADPQCDVYWNNELATTIKLKQHGVLARFVPPSARGIPAAFKDPEGYWTGFAARARILIVNTNEVKPADMPNSMWDLAEPRWRGRVCMARPETGTTAAHAVALYVRDPETADEYFDALIRNDVVWLTGNAHCMREVSAGRFAFGWTDTDDFNVARIKGQPVSKVYPDTGPDAAGVMYIPNSLVLINGAPHRRDAERLIDWLLRPAIEEELARSATAQIPVRTGVQVPPGVLRPAQVGKVMQVDWDRAGKEYDRWVDHLRTKLRSAEESSPALWWIVSTVATLALVAALLLKRAAAEPA